MSKWSSDYPVVELNNTRDTYVDLLPGFIPEADYFCTERESHGLEPLEIGTEVVVRWSAEARTQIDIENEKRPIKSPISEYIAIAKIHDYAEPADPSDPYFYTVEVIRYINAKKLINHILQLEQFISEHKFTYEQYLLKRREAAKEIWWNGFDVTSLGEEDIEAWSEAAKSGAAGADISQDISQVATSLIN